MQSEVWRDVVGFEGFYQVSNLGNVKGTPRSGCRGKIRAWSIGKRGYPIVTLYKPGIARTRPIHRLLAEAFIPNPGNKREVNHINGIKTDNRLDNLEWTTPLENSRHSLTLKACRRSNRKRGAYRVNEVEWQAQIRIDGKTRFLGYHTTKDAAHEAYRQAYIKHYGFTPWD